jgi:hypothetical protein
MSQTWAMSKALSELMARHDVTIPAPEAVGLSEPIATPMVLSGLASTLDIERVAFAPFAFELSSTMPPLKFDHTEENAGRIEMLAHNDRGELTISAYVDHPTAVRCNAFSVSGDVLDYTLHDTGKPSFFARVERVRLREVSLVPAPINNQARVLKRELPSAMSRFAASSLKQFDLLIAGCGLIQKNIVLLQGMNRGS